MDDLPLLDLSSPKHKRMLIERINAMKGIHRVSITKVKQQRSLSQNAYLFGVVYPAICPTLSECEGEEVDSLTAHEFFKAKFLRRAIINKNTGEMIGCHVRSSTDLDVGEMSAFIQQVIEFAYDKLGVNVPTASAYEQQEKVSA